MIPHPVSYKHSVRWGGQAEWESMEEAVNLDWVGVAGPLMKRYVEATKHPTLEIKHSAIVWRYEEVDPARAKEMEDLMKDLLLHEPVVIKSGHRSIEVHPQVREIWRVICIT